MMHFQCNSTMPKQICVLVAVLCGKITGKPKQDSEKDRPLYPFPELVSGGRLEVHTLNNPTTDEFQCVLESLGPDFVYLQGENSTKDDEIGSLVWGDVNLSTVEAITRLFGCTLPSTVYLELPNGKKLAEALYSKGVPYVIYWRSTFSRYAASHFRQALTSVLQSSRSHTWDIFQLAQSSFRLFCVRNNHVLPVNGQKDGGKVGPHLLGEPPKIDVVTLGKDSGDEGSLGNLAAIKIYDDEVSMRFLVCGEPCTLDACLLGSLEDGLNALLSIEIRGSKLHNRVSAPPPPLQAGAFSRGVVTMRCDLSTCSSAHISLLVSGSSQTCFDDQLLESLIKTELIEKSQLVRALPSCEESKPFLFEPRKSVSIACGASVFEVCMKVPTWAAQVLRQLAPEVSFRSLVALGIASIHGSPVASFEIDDAERLLFFCSEQGKNNLSSDQNLKVAVLTEPPQWFKPPAPSSQRLESDQSTRASINNDGAGIPKPEQDDVLEIRWRDVKCSLVAPISQKLKMQAMRPIPHTRQRKLLPFCRVSEVDTNYGSSAKTYLSNVPSMKHNYVSSVPVIHRKSTPSSFQAQQIISLNPLPLKKHGCGRCPIQICSEEEFLKDVMQFLILRGHHRLVPQGGLAEFPDAILNAKRLDLYNLYREVVSRGGFHVGNGINWKGQVFSKMGNHTLTNRMTGVGNTLKRHYETYLLEYELAHDDVDGECCLLCHSSAAGDWVNCGICGEWAHFGCDRRPGLGAFKDYAKTDGLEYICPHCSVTSFQRKSRKTAYGYPQALVV